MGRVGRPERIRRPRTSPDSPLDFSSLGAGLYSSPNVGPASELEDLRLEHARFLLRLRRLELDLLAIDLTFAWLGRDPEAVGALMAAWMETT
jgi:hypothetical protein